MSQGLRALVMIGVGMTLLSCNAPPRPQETVNSAPPPAAYGTSTYAHAALPPENSASRLVWRASPRWAAIREENSTSAVHDEEPDKFAAAQAKAKKLGVHTLTNEDIDGLSYAQIKEIRGY